MSGASSSDILIAGAGIAGLTAALAFAERGFCVRVFERAPLLVEVGAGLQLSPNATRLLDRLGLGEALRKRAVRPQAVVLRRAATGRQVARVPLGDAALKRWGADYLVMHRADLQSVLGAAAHAHPAIRLYFGHDLCGARERPGAVMADMEVDGRAVSAEGRLLVGADGVWSRLRAGMDGGACRAVGHTAWRTIIPGDALAAGALEPGVVTAFLAKRFHLVAYPLRGGREWNLVAITPDRAVGAVEGEWASAADPSRLRETLADAGPLLRGLADAAREWTAWPLVEVVGDTPWHVGRQVLIGDAAHAMTPHAAQGAGMAIEDACVLAAQMAAGGEDVERALARYETRRRPRVERVRRRGRFNRFVWHAWGPIALGRDLALAARPQGALAADFDWLYGWRPEET